MRQSIVAGVAQMVAGAYMTEIAPVAIRGSVGVCSQVGIVIGISIGVGIGIDIGVGIGIRGAPPAWVPAPGT